MLGSLLGGRAGQLHLRLISQGQELYRDMDERSLADLGFKDLQLVFANLDELKVVQALIPHIDDEDETLDQMLQALSAPHPEAVRLAIVEQLSSTLKAEYVALACVCTCLVETQCSC